MIVSEARGRADLATPKIIADEQMINKELYERSKTSTISALNLLTSYLKKGEQVPSRTVEKNTIQGEGSWSPMYVDEPMFFVFLHRHPKEIESLPEYVACTKLMKSDGTITKQLDGPIGTYAMTVRQTAWDYLSRFAIDQLALHSGQNIFDSNIFDTNVWRSGTILLQ